MAVPKTTQTRYMDGSVQATQSRRTTQLTPSLYLILYHHQVDYELIQLCAGNENFKYCERERDNGKTNFRPEHQTWTHALEQGKDALNQ